MLACGFSYPFLVRASMSPELIFYASSLNYSARKKFVWVLVFLLTTKCAPAFTSSRRVLVPLPPTKSNIHPPNSPVSHSSPTVSRQLKQIAKLCASNLEQHFRCFIIFSPFFIFMFRRSVSAPSTWTHPESCTFVWKWISLQKTADEIDGYIYFLSESGLLGRLTSCHMSRSVFVSLFMSPGIVNR